MNTIPAKIAKVRRLVLATPKVNGKLNSAVLYAAKKVGIKEIYSMVEHKPLLVWHIYKRLTK